MYNGSSGCSVGADVVIQLIDHEQITFSSRQTGWGPGIRPSLVLLTSLSTGAKVQHLAHGLSERYVVIFEDITRPVCVSDDTESNYIWKVIPHKIFESLEDHRSPLVCDHALDISFS
jgi:hypothetical protein